MTYKTWIRIESNFHKCTGGIKFLRFFVFVFRKEEVLKKSWTQKVRKMNLKNNEDKRERNIRILLRSYFLITFCKQNSWSFKFLLLLSYTQADNSSKR